MSRHQSLHGVDVLVVEDHPDDRDLLVFVLERWGARVTAAASAGEVLTAFDRARPDAVVCDIRLGRGEAYGYAFLAEVRRRPEASRGATPVIAVSGYTDEYHRRRILEAGRVRAAGSALRRVGERDGEIVASADLWLRCVTTKAKRARDPKKAKRAARSAACAAGPR